jgi:hypothetical protein
LLRWQRFVIAGFALVAASCSGTPDPSLEDLCQFRGCVCADEKAAFWQLADKKPLLWRQNGRPYCPPGYALRQSGEP